MRNNYFQSLTGRRGPRLPRVDAYGRSKGGCDPSEIPATKLKDQKQQRHIGFNSKKEREKESERSNGDTEKGMKRADEMQIVS